MIFRKDLVKIPFSMEKSVKMVFDKIIHYLHFYIFGIKMLKISRKMSEEFIPNPITYDNYYVFGKRIARIRRYEDWKKEN